ncbi:MAG: hypothetical protein ACPGUD_13980 [Parashewanella sp.]
MAAIRSETQSLQIESDSAFKKQSTFEPKTSLNGFQVEPQESDPNTTDFQGVSSVDIVEPIADHTETLSTDSFEFQQTDSLPLPPAPPNSLTETATSLSERDAILLEEVFFALNSNIGTVLEHAFWNTCLEVVEIPPSKADKVRVSRQDLKMAKVSKSNEAVNFFKLIQEYALLGNLTNTQAIAKVEQFIRQFVGNIPLAGKVASASEREKLMPSSSQNKTETIPQKTKVIEHVKERLGMDLTKVELSALLYIASIRSIISENDIISMEQNISALSRAQQFETQVHRTVDLWFNHFEKTAAKHDEAFLQLHDLVVKLGKVRTARLMKTFPSQ